MLQRHRLQYSLTKGRPGRNAAATLLPYLSLHKTTYSQATSKHGAKQ